MNLIDHYKKTEKLNDIELTDDLKKMVMSSCDVRSILESWNVRPVLINGKQWKGYCPDHYLHDGHSQHLPKWFMSAENGDCICFTSSKASNFIYVAKRIYNLSTIRETIDVLTNGKEIVLPLPSFIVDEDVCVSNEIELKKEEERQKGILMVEKLLKSGGLSDKCIEYFANDGINKDTLDFLGICSVEKGYLEGRAVIPFLDSEHNICGYVAVNYMGKEWWVKKNYDKMHKIDSNVSIESIEKGYRKTLYCPGFSSRNHLYGLYEVLNGKKNLDSITLVEGERDAMKLLQEGIDCVSIHGTFLKEEQKTILKKLNPSKVFLGFDMDKAGDEATKKIFKALSGEVEDIYVLNFPGNKDPKKFNKEELNNLINKTLQERIRSRIYE